MAHSGKSYRKDDIMTGKNRRKGRAALLSVCTAALLFLPGCGSAPAETGTEVTTETVTEAATEAEPETVPEVGSIRNICKAAVLKCEYHNVAKSVKHKGKGWKHTGEKDRKFWIEYRGTVEISFDAKKVQMKTEGTHITVTLPEPELECEVIPESWTEDSYVIEPDNQIKIGKLKVKYAQNPITYEDQKAAVASAQEDMERQVRENSSLIDTAENQLKELVRNYIDQVGKMTDQSYQVTFQDADTASDGNAAAETTAAQSAAQ